MKNKSGLLKDLYSAYTEDELWLIKETEWVRKLQNVRESQFALGNGYIGSRGVLEGIPYDAIPGTYISGVYDKLTSQVSELVNLPNPFNFRFTIEGEKVDVVAMDVLQHKRVLNMKKGLLIRRTLYSNSRRRRYDLQSIRFLSMSSKNIGVMQVAFTSLDENCKVDINTGIDTSVYNIGVLTEGRKKHFRVRELGQYRNAGFLGVETFEKKYFVIYWSGFYYRIGSGREVYAKDNIFKLSLKKGQTAVFTKVFYAGHFMLAQSYAHYKNQSFRRFYKAFHSPFNDLLDKHIKAWDKLWKKADVLVEGTANIQQNLRFNIYHMLICGSDDKGFSSIGARTLSGEGYRGHIFWDTEIFLLPFYLYNFPNIAGNMLLYRYRRLDAARQIAKRNGYKGAMFPWESADTGEDETPEWAKDIDGSIIKIYTNKLEHHITADIGYALYHYFKATADEGFMINYGYEMLVEIARFWFSRLEYDSKKGTYSINDVIGPDEFHIHINNNAFTNMLVQWCLSAAADLVGKLKKVSPSVYSKIKKKVNLKDSEIKNWKKSSLQISINKKGRIIEQFDGYSRLKKVIPRESDENGVPLIPSHLGPQDLAKTQIIKQADVVMLLYLLRDKFTREVVRANWDFYAPRTVHKSSLSPSINSIVGSISGDLHRAYALFNAALRIDISNLYGNTNEGIHAASLGGSWQAVIFGFAGLDTSRGFVSVNPAVPMSWGKIVFSLWWQGTLLKFEVSNDIVKVKSLARRKDLEIEVFGKKYVLSPYKTNVFSRKTVLNKQYYCY